MGKGSREPNELLERIGRLPPTRDPRPPGGPCETRATGRVPSGTHRDRPRGRGAGSSVLRRGARGPTRPDPNRRAALALPEVRTHVVGAHRHAGPRHPPCPDLFVRALRGMMGEAPRSCRKLARVLGVSRHTVWRWRMIVIHALPAERTDRLAGIVEADEAPRRESEPRGRGSGSDTRRTPSAIPDRLGCPGANTQSSPPSRRRRRAAGPTGTGSGSRRPTAADTVRLKAIADASQPAISAARLSIMAPDAGLGELWPGERREDRRG